MKKSYQKVNKTRKKPKQLSLDNTQFKTKKEFGGSLLKKSHAKEARPISTKNAMHVTLKSRKATGTRSMLASRQRALLIEKKVYSLSRKFGIKIYRYANVGNHMHLLLKASTRDGFINFLKSISGIIVRILLNTQRGIAALKNKEKTLDSFKAISSNFWDQRPWTRIVAWMNDYYNVKNYVQKNFQQASGFHPTAARNLKTFISTA